MTTKGGRNRGEGPSAARGTEVELLGGEQRRCSTRGRNPRGIGGGGKYNRSLGHDHSINADKRLVNEKNQGSRHSVLILRFKHHEECLGRGGWFDGEGGIRMTVAKDWEPLHSRGVRGGGGKLQFYLGGK